MQSFDLPDLYKAASRFCLDLYGNWEPEQMEELSMETRLKLEKKSVSYPSSLLIERREAAADRRYRRCWYLERVCKLGMTDMCVSLVLSFAIFEAS